MRAAVVAVCAGVVVAVACAPPSPPNERNGCIRTMTTTPGDGLGGEGPLTWTMQFSKVGAILGELVDNAFNHVANVTGETSGVDADVTFDGVDDARFTASGASRGGSVVECFSEMDGTFEGATTSGDWSTTDSHATFVQCSRDQGSGNVFCTEVFLG